MSKPVVGYAHVAVERAVDRYPDGLTYAVPAEPAPLADVRPGRRVIVPLGRSDRPVAGYVVDRFDASQLDADLDPSKIKCIDRLDDAAAELPGQLIDLARWMSGYYCCPIGITLASMLPAAVKRNVGAVTRTLVDLADAPDGEPAGRLSPKQRAVLDLLASLPVDERPIEIADLASRAGLKTKGPIRKLIDAGRLTTFRKTNIEADWADRAVDTATPERLTDQQQRVLDDVSRAVGRGYSTHMLYGVTGSGKTEIYIRLMQRVLETGRSALMLVPEIALTPQTGGRLLGRFADQRVAVLHSGLTAAQRHQQWSLAASGAARIVLGTRSAVFAPIPDDQLGVIVVDEEHDGSYKQDQAPRYHGRDVAVRRAHLAGCPVLLGSATPSMESWHNAVHRRSYHLHQLPQRAPGMKLPKVRIVDFAEQRRQRRDKRVHLIGPVMEQAIERTLETGGQALILLNRRGYANYIACPDQICGWVMTCRHCDATVVYHRHGSLPAGGFVRCHHCLSEQKLPEQCPLCTRRVVTFGLGTQRVEEELSRKFASLCLGTTMLRLDADTMHSARDFHDALDRFGRGEVRVLLGTQMIAKGLDFPNVRLVGVINADTAISLPDFRATERTFQLVSQVAGRGGRSEQPGHVIVQTFHPDMPAIQLAATHDYPSFARQELAERQQCGLPPFARLARIVVRDPDHVRARTIAERTAEALRQVAAESARAGEGGRDETDRGAPAGAAPGETPSGAMLSGGGTISGGGVQVRGPSACVIARVADYHRFQVELIAATAGELQSLITAGRNRGIITPGSTMAIDVDPTALM